MSFSVCVINQSINRHGIYFGFSYFFKTIGHTILLSPIQGHYKSMMNRDKKKNSKARKFGCMRLMVNQMK